MREILVVTYILGSIFVITGIGDVQPYPNSPPTPYTTQVFVSYLTAFLTCCGMNKYYNFIKDIYVRRFKK